MGVVNSFHGCGQQHCPSTCPRSYLFRFLRAELVQSCVWVGQRSFSNVEFRLGADRGRGRHRGRRRCRVIDKQTNTPATGRQADTEEGHRERTTRQRRLGWLFERNGYIKTDSPRASRFVFLSTPASERPPCPTTVPPSAPQLERQGPVRR